ncbi:bifunctional heptose 7-phosphate kinase/heptose 1-phosphate adenyltransferase, partial [Actinotalea ferrariae]|uniref:PfkB family carbohydrate kinase n=1 Tax=Actinotalea ferrariae TaxID=1386098 RepID=UPI001EB969DF
MTTPEQRAGREPHVVVLGDVVLDTDVDGTVERLCPDAPVPVLDVTGRRHSPGGAGLTALLCAESGARVTLVAPVADDDGGARLAEQLGRRVTLVPLGHEGGTRTKVRVRSSGQSLVRVDEGGPGTPRDVSEDEVRAVLATADVVLVSDYGAGVTRDPVLRALLARAARERVVVWDPHPRGGDPVPGVTLVTPNLAEATRAADGLGTAAPGAPADVLASELCAAWEVRAVSVTAGAAG